MGVAGLNRKRGPKKGFSAARAGSDAAPAPDAPSELARAKARIAELERKVGKQQMDIDFFREALRLIDALEAKTLAAETNAGDCQESCVRGPG
jgi:hypothetical protein